MAGTQARLLKVTVSHIPASICRSCSCYKGQNLSKDFGGHPIVPHTLAHVIEVKNQKTVEATHNRHPLAKLSLRNQLQALAWYFVTCLCMAWCWIVVKNGVVELLGVAAKASEGHSSRLPRGLLLPANLRSNLLPNYFCTSPALSRSWRKNPLFCCCTWVRPNLRALMPTTAHLLPDTFCRLLLLSSIYGGTQCKPLLASNQ